MGGYDPVTLRTGVQVWIPEQACPGINLVVSGHDPEIMLIDMQGRRLHSWVFPRNQAFSEPAGTQANERARSFRRALLLPDGGLLGVYNGTGMVRLTADSEPVWVQKARCHHDLTRAPDGSIYSIVHRKRLVPDLNPAEPVIDEFIVQMDFDTGKILREISVLDAFTESVYAPYLKKIPRSGDVLHANTVVYLDAGVARLAPIFTEGHLLISLRNMDTIAILDPDAKQITWALTGMWSYQHEPCVLNSGHLLLFDNIGHRGRSKVMEFDPMTQVITWQYADSPDTPLFSATSGTCSRLPNGNTLIVESNRGYALEVTSRGEIVWDFLNPGTWGPDNNLRGTLFDVKRIDPTRLNDEFRQRLAAL